MNLVYISVRKIYIYQSDSHKVKSVCPVYTRAHMNSIHTRVKKKNVDISSVYVKVKKLDIGPVYTGVEKFHVGLV